MLFEASFEDYLYILVGAVWIAYSVYKGIQKNKSRQNKDVKPAEKKKSVFESFIDNILVEEKPLPYVPEGEEIAIDDTDIKIAEKQNEVFSYDDDYEESNFQSDLDVYKNISETPAKEKQKNNKSLSFKRKKPRVDLRKAVVYSEILNRRYF